MNVKNYTTEVDGDEQGHGVRQTMAEVSLPTSLYMQIVTTPTEEASRERYVLNISLKSTD